MDVPAVVELEPAVEDVPPVLASLPLPPSPPVEVLPRPSSFERRSWS
jgi:hypothetical protein